MEGYMTIKQAAEKWDVTPRRIQFLCSKGEYEIRQMLWKNIGKVHLALYLIQN